jgi:Ca2+-binding RTX toxin-like protein
MMRMAILVLTVVLSEAAFALTLTGTGGGDSLRGSDEADTPYARGGFKSVFGYGGHDRLFGEGGADGLSGGSGNVQVHGGSVDDRSDERLVQGGSGNDTVWDDAGEDTIYGGPGADTIYSVGDDEGDVVDCGLGSDTVKKGSDQDLDRFINCEKFFDYLTRFPGARDGIAVGWKSTFPPTASP